MVAGCRSHGDRLFGCAGRRVRGARECRPACALVHASANGGVLSINPATPPCGRGRVLSRIELRAPLAPSERGGVARRDLNPQPLR